MVVSLDGNKREVRDLSDIQVGMQVMMKDKQPSLVGLVQFIGQTSFASGIWVGIKLEVPLGKNNGIVQGVKYFQCLPLHGLFVRPQQLVIWTPPIVEQPIKAIEIPRAPVVPVPSESPSLRRPINKVGNDSPSRTNAEKLRATLNIAHALKVKISKEMHMLNHQLEMVESFESQVQGTEGVNQEDCSQFVSSLVSVMYEEEHMCKEFRTLIHGQQQQQGN
jgi:dynactin complex subunit